MTHSSIERQETPRSQGNGVDSTAHGLRVVEGRHRHENRPRAWGGAILLVHGE